MLDCCLCELLFVPRMLQVSDILLIKRQSEKIQHKVGRGAVRPIYYNNDYSSPKTHSKTTQNKSLNGAFLFLINWYIDIFHTRSCVLWEFWCRKFCQFLNWTNYKSGQSWLKSTVSVCFRYVLIPPKNRNFSFFPRICDTFLIEIGNGKYF